MRWLLSTVATAAVLGAHAQITDGESRPRVRRSMGFMPELPHARFETQLTYASYALKGLDDPFAIATDYMHSLQGLLSPQSSFRIREDSYTDKLTGITHVYVRQLWGGLDVANGDVQLAIKDGVILTASDSFFRGVDIWTPQDLDVHGHYCAQAEGQLTRLKKQNTYSEDNNAQTTFGEEATCYPHELSQWWDSNCATLDFARRVFPTGDFAVRDDASLPQVALAQFMVYAAPTTFISWSQQTFRSAVHQSIQTFHWLQYLRGFQVQVQPSADPADGTLYSLWDVPGTTGPVKARKAWMQAPRGDSAALVAVWKLEVRMEDNWYEATVQSDAPYRIVSVVDWVADAPPRAAPVPIPGEPNHLLATYRVFGWGVNDPDAGKRTLQKEHVDTLASPLGWHTLLDSTGAGSRKTTTTIGNNVFAQENWAGAPQWLDNYRPDAGAKLVFDYKWNPKETDSDDAKDEAQKYINASITQIFYTTNMVHDLYYRYGFDEVSGNFQEHNHGRGGQENDAVVIDAQNGAGMNNADFATPPDGQTPRCRMFLWNTANPYRDGAFESGVVVHELSHGLSIRLTGGPANSACLGMGESAGMGEGWGDFFATLIRSNAKYSDYPMGSWVANNVKGIRRYPYSTDLEVNPSTYKTLDGLTYWEPHAIGEVWAELLFVVAQKLIKKHGFSETLFPPAPLPDGTIPEGDFYRPPYLDQYRRIFSRIPKHGNSLAVQLVITGMKLQPCMPSFFDARDAIIAADKALTGGENLCEIWAGFAERGLGPKARVLGRMPWGGGFRINDFSVPNVCQ